MASNQDKIFEKYSARSEDGREKQSRNDGLEYYYTKKHLEGFITKEDRILEIGCATGHYGFYYADKCKAYVGIDLYPPHIELFSRRIQEGNFLHLSCRTGDAVNLNGFPDGSFDVVLSLGPMYHLPPEERELAFSEAARVCKVEATLAFAYIVQLGTYAGACVYDDRYPNPQADEYVFSRGTDDVRPGLFYFSMPEEMEEAAARYGLKKVKNLGTNFMFAMKLVNEMTDERFARMQTLYDRMTSCESCTGLAGHALFICTKQAAFLPCGAAE